MDLQQIKDTLNKAGFSEESSKVLNQILDQAIARGSITHEEKTKLLGIIDIEIDAANIEADTMEDVAMALASFADDADRAADKAAEDIENIDKDLSSDIDTAVNTASNPSQSSPISNPAMPPTQDPMTNPSPTAADDPNSTPNPSSSPLSSS